ncbi:NAD(P)/FAD-dependent oxidoreductase [Palleronia sp. KMU-117]|uniref:NAD(P)/FAD-dependent oxidoreductase n=1 Tax=Palleronia sp. KMU-117 TaxID=3434108 RepID=UPI003D705662
MTRIANERAALADSLWTATANSAPARPALDHAAEADVAIVGGGYTGLSAALRLAEAGQRVILLEAETPGWGASGRNGGQVNPGFKDSPDEIEARFGDGLGRRMVALAGEAGDLVFDLIDRHGIACAPRRTGWIRAATTPKALASLGDLARQWQARGAEVEPLDRRAIAALTGTEAYLGGLIDRRGGNLHPLNYALGLAAAAERAGARLHGQSRVTALHANGEVVTVETAAGRVTARAALICTNAYTGRLADPLGRSVLPVTSIQVATEPLGDNLAQSILPDGQQVSDSRRLLLYFRKDAEGRFIMGGRGALGEAGTRARHQALRAASLRLYPHLKDVRWTHAWGGDVALTASHRPGLHRLAPGVMAALGYNGRGVAMATAMGRLLADWAQGRPEADLGFPVTEARTIPFHRFRRLGLGPTVAAFSVLDRLGV